MAREVEGVDPSLADQIAYYDEWNSSHRGGAYEEIEPEIRGRGEHVLRELRALGLDRPRIIEIGCGTGWLSVPLADLGPVTGIDLSPRAIEIAEARGLPESEFIAGDFYAQDFADASFDVAVCIETLFYVPAQAEFVEKMARLMKPGGILGLTTINKYVYERSSDIGPPKPGQVRRWLSRGEIEQLLAPWFEDIRVQTVEPRGDQGILRLVNSYKVTQIATKLASPQKVKSLKEKLGFGGGLVFLARRRSN